MKTASALLAALILTVVAWEAPAQEGQFLTQEEAPRAVFPDADRFERDDILVTDGFRDLMRSQMGGTTPSIWEPQYVSFRAWKGQTPVGRAFFVEEIGKHRPITFVVGIRPDGRVEDVAVVAYREAYGGEIRSKRFLGQYREKGPSDSLRPRAAITNIAGATLSVEAASRAVKKAMALERATAPQSAGVQAGDARR